MSDKNLGIYIHVPFCSSKCPYCDFFSYKCNDLEIKKYTNEVIKSLKYWSAKTSNTTVDTIYFGGGTPSLLKTERIVKIISEVKNYFTVDKNCEVTLEINPNSCKLLDFNQLNKIGVNRISIGVQSANEDELKVLGRKHTNEDVITTVKMINAAGIVNYSMDLMIGISLQNEERLINSINFCSDLGCSHISAYLLKVEENTPYSNIKNRLNLPSDDKQSDLYYSLYDKLEEKGYKNYEISNFSKLGFESKHNLKYWLYDNYLGIGPSAHSFFNGRRFFYPRSFSEFYNNNFIDDTYEDKELEYSMLRLRLKNGLTQNDYKTKFKKKIPEMYYKNAIPYSNAGFVICDDNGIRITKKGILLSNTLISNIIL